MPGLFLQISVLGGARSRLSLALHETPAESRADRNLQSQLLRRSAHRSCASRVSGKAENSAAAGWEKHLGEAFRRHPQLRTISRAQRRPGSKILSSCIEEGTEAAVPGANRRPEEELEVLVE